MANWAHNGEGLAAHEIFELANAIPKIVTRIQFILHNTGQAADFIQQLRTMIDESYGATRVNISLLVEGQIVETQTAQSLTFTISNQNYKILRRHPALAGVRIQTIPVKAIDDRPAWKKRKVLHH